MGLHHSHFGIQGSQVSGPSFASTLSTDYNGTDELVDFGDILDYADTDKFGGFVWIKVDTADIPGGNGPIFGRRADGLQGGWVFLVNSSAEISLLLVEGATGTTYSWAKSNTATATVPDNTWVHVGFGYNGDSDSTNMKFWINGVDAGNVNINNALAGSISTATSFRIGDDNAPNAERFKGRMGDIFIMNDMPTDAEALEIYNSGSELDMETFSDWATQDASSKAMWLTWEADDLDVGDQPGVTDLTSNGFTGTAVAMSTAANLVLDVPPT